MLEERDHRVRVARERRDRMRKRLLAAVIASYAKRLADGPPTVDLVVAEAQVSRATFYKYFNSVEEAIEALGNDLSDEMVDNLISLFPDDAGVFIRMSVAVQLFLMRSATDPLWGSFVSRTDTLGRDSEMTRGLSRHLRIARAEGTVDFDDLEAAASFVLGTLMEAMRRLAQRRQGTEAYVAGVMVLILRGLGVGVEEARAIVIDHTRFIRTTAPNRLAWWSDPWQ